MAPVPHSLAQGVVEPPRVGLLVGAERRAGPAIRQRPRCDDRRQSHPRGRLALLSPPGALDSRRTPAGATVAVMATVIDREEERAGESIRSWLETQDVGGIRPVEVRKRRVEDSFGELSWFFEMVLPNPPSREETWPVRGIMDLDLALRDRALAEGLSFPWYLRFKPEFDDEPAEEDDPPDD